MFENSRRGRQARNFTKNVPKILSQIVFPTGIFRKLTLRAPAVIPIYLQRPITGKRTGVDPGKPRKRSDVEATS